MDRQNVLTESESDVQQSTSPVRKQPLAMKRPATDSQPTTSSSKASKTQKKDLMFCPDTMDKVDDNAFVLVPTPVAKNRNVAFLELFSGSACLSKDLVSVYQALLASMLCLCSNAACIRSQLSAPQAQSLPCMVNVLGD